MNILERAQNSLKYRLGIKDTLHADLFAVLARIPVDFGGSCSLQKAFVMGRLIRRYKLKSTVDIGVYHGGSLFPQAHVHQKYTKGVVYAVDPWSMDAARQKDNPALLDKLEEWAEVTDLEAIYNEVKEAAREYGRHIVIVRKPSLEAVKDFSASGIRFDMVHVDGNHDIENALGDVREYIPLLNPGGFIVMDDIGWDSVKPAYDFCASRLSLVYERRDVGYAVFRNSKDVASVKQHLADYIHF